MAWRASVGSIFRKLNFSFNEKSSSAWGVAGFLEANYSHLKAHNPDLPVQVRGTVDPKPFMECFTWDNRLIKTDLSGFSPQEIESALRSACGNINALPADIAARSEVRPLGPTHPIKPDLAVDGAVWHPGLKSLRSKYISDII